MALNGLQEMPLEAVDLHNEVQPSGLNEPYPQLGLLVNHKRT